LCQQCNHERRYPPPPSVSLSSSSPSSVPPPPPPLFDRPFSCIDQLTPVQRAAIVTLWLDNQDRQTIAHKIPCHLNTVGHWVREWQHRRELSDAERSGRPRCTTDSNDIRIEELAEEKKFTTPFEMRNELELDVSYRTIRRRLDEVGLYGRVARTEHAYTEEQRRKRLSFAEGYLNWKEEDWERVIFSDETHFNHFSRGRHWVQRPVGTAFDPLYLAHDTENFQTVSLWSCFCAKGIGQAEIYVGEYNAARHNSFLQANLLATYRHFYPTGLWWFLQDNAPQHKAKIAQVWLHNHGINCLDFPPYSPDLNPIENLFHNLKVRVFKHFPTSAADIEAALHAEYEHLPTDLLTQLAHSMPDRLKAVIENQGHKTKY
jgi:transposase